MTIPQFSEGIVSVPVKYCVTQYLGRTVHSREDSLFFYLFQRVVEEGQWLDGTDAHQYLGDERGVILHDVAHLCLDYRRGGNNEEWPHEEERLKQMEQYRVEGALTSEQHARYEDLKQLVVQNRPIIRRLQES